MISKTIDMVPFFVRLQSMVLTMFPLIFFFVPFNQGYEKASVGFVVNGKKSGQTTIFVQQVCT